LLLLSPRLLPPPDNVPAAAADVMKQRSVQTGHQFIQQTTQCLLIIVLLVLLWLPAVCHW
jgi:hypothetical protein